MLLNLKKSQGRSTRRTGLEQDVRIRIYATGKTVPFKPISPLQAVLIPPPSLGIHLSASWLSWFSSVLSFYPTQFSHLLVLYLALFAIFFLDLYSLLETTAGPVDDPVLSQLIYSLRCGAVTYLQCNLFFFSNSLFKPLFTFFLPFLLYFLSCVFYSLLTFMSTPAPFYLQPVIYNPFSWQHSPLLFSVLPFSSAFLFPSLHLSFYGN